MVQSSITSNKTDEFSEVFSQFLLMNLSRYLSESVETSVAQMVLVASLEKVKKVKR